MGNKSSDEIQKALEEARKKVEVGGQYVHFKSPDQSYTILNTATLVGFCSHQLIEQRLEKQTLTTS